MSFLAHRSGTSRKPANLQLNHTLPPTSDVAASGRRGSVSDTDIRKSVDMRRHPRSQSGTTTFLSLPFTTTTIPAAVTTTASPTEPEFKVSTFSSFEQPDDEVRKDGISFSSGGGDDSRLSPRSANMQLNLTRRSNSSDSSLYTQFSTVTDCTGKRSIAFSGGASISSDATSMSSLRSPPASAFTTGFNPLTCTDVHGVADPKAKAPDEQQSMTQASKSGYGASAL